MSNPKYATIDIPEALSFTAISNKIAKDGYNLTPARTRLILMKSLERIVRRIGKKYDYSMSRENAQLIVKDPNFQNIIAPLIQMSYGA